MIFLVALTVDWIHFIKYKFLPSENGCKRKLKRPQQHGLTLPLEDCCTGSITQNHPWKTYVMSFGLYFEVCTKKFRISKKNRIYGPIFGGKWRKWLFFRQNKWYFRKYKLYFNSVALGWKYYQNATLQPLNGLCSFNIKRVIADRISRKTQFFIKICLFCWFFPNFSGTSGIIRKLLELGDRAMKTLRNELLYDTVGQGVSEMRI